MHIPIERAVRLCGKDATQPVAESRLHPAHGVLYKAVALLIECLRQVVLTLGPGGMFAGKFRVPYASARRTCVDFLSAGCAARALR